MDEYNAPLWTCNSVWWRTGRLGYQELPEGTRNRSSWLDEMHSRRLLEENAHAAALRYESDWFAAGMTGVRARDYERPFVDGGEGGDRVPSARQEASRWALRTARAVLGGFATVVDMIVLGGATAGDLTYLSPQRNRGKAIADIMRRLRAGLRLLAEHYDIIPAPLTEAEAQALWVSVRANDLMVAHHEYGLQVKTAGNSRESPEISDPDGIYVGAASGFARVDTFMRRVEKGNRYEPDEDDEDEDDELDLGHAGEGVLSRAVMGDVMAIADARDDARAAIAAMRGSLAQGT